MKQMFLILSFFRIRRKINVQAMLKLKIAMLLITLPIALGAKELGTQGSVYEIKEQDALQWIYKRLQHMQANGEIERQQEKLKERVLLSLERPTSVKGLKATQKPRMFEKDLTIIVSEDIKDAHGKLIHAAGTQMNPLKTRVCNKILIFLDGDNPKQLQWALNQYQQKPDLVKLVLMNGPVLQLMRTLDIPLYFDQAGKLVQYFAIEQVPATVSQIKDKLSIREVKL